MDSDKFTFYIDLAKLRVRTRIGAGAVKERDWHPALEAELKELGVQHTDILRKSHLLDRAT